MVVGTKSCSLRVNTALQLRSDSQLCFAGVSAGRFLAWVFAGLVQTAVCGRVCMRAHVCVCVCVILSAQTPWARDLLTGMSNQLVAKKDQETGADSRAVP